MVDVVSYPRSRLNDTSTEVWDIIQKMPPIKDEGNLMFSQQVVLHHLLLLYCFCHCKDTNSKAIYN